MFSTVSHSVQDLAQDDNYHSNRRQLDEKYDIVDMNCDGAFLGCMHNDACAACFLELRDYEIDWATVTKSTPCEEIAAFLQTEKICKKLKDNHAAMTAFCQTYHSCVFWKSGSDEKKKKDEGKQVDCDSLKECQWEGMHESFIGDGVCHENMEGCYNTAICNYDGGDCCADTCKTAKDSYIECGHEGYACRDPKSKDCDSSLTTSCADDDNKKEDDKVPDCDDKGSAYRLLMHDAFGDGWDDTTITITNKKDGSGIFTGSLKDGAEGQEYICLEESKCYSVEAKGGMWGKEVSWDVKGFSSGAATYASGGSPMKCEFSVKDGCDNTCFGKTDEDPTKDPDYKEYKTLKVCLEKNCVIQTKSCEQDDKCKVCLQEVIPDSCNALELFNSVLDCAVCQCTDRKGSDACMNNLSPEKKLTPSGGKEKKAEAECTPIQIMEGGSALQTFNGCTNFDKMVMMLTDFNSNEFGDLDKFEECAHNYEGRKDHGGKTALECLQILVDTVDGKEDDESKGDDKAKTIEALATELYKHSESFCDCAKKSSEQCPLCPSFFNFKTLLYESLDACQALDEIDCPSWEEFYTPCYNNILKKDSSVDFKANPDLCDYVKSGCGGAGPYPAFRKLDCYKEISSESWQFHDKFAAACLGDSSPSPGPPAPKPTPRARTPAPTEQYVSPEDRKGKPDTPPKPDTKPTDAPDAYVPPEDKGEGKKSSTQGGNDGKKKKKSHWFRNLVIFMFLGGAGFYAYKKRRDGFGFSNYQRMHRGFGSQDMYSGLSMDSSTNFEPISMPPQMPSMGQQMGNMMPQMGNMMPQMSNMMGNMMPQMGGMPNMGGQPQQQQQYSSPQFNQQQQF